MESQVDRALCDRFMKVVDHYGKTYEPFCEEFDFHRATISDIKKYRREPSRDILDRIIAKGDIFEAWLRRGQGQMLRPEAKKQIKDSTVQPKPEHFQEAIRLVEDALQGRFLPVEKKVELITLVAEDLAEPPPGEEDTKAYIRGLVRGLVRDRLERNSPE